MASVAEAQAIGYGGVALVNRATGVSRQTIHNGLEELKELSKAKGSSRKTGGGRKKIVDLDPTILRALDEFVDPATRGDPESPLRWTCKSTRELARTLFEKGYKVSHNQV